MLVELSEGADPLAIADDLRQRSGVEYAQPDFVTIGRHLTRRSPASADPAATSIGPGSRYAAQITGAAEAWALQLGSPAIRVAILDEGVETDHPDLATRIAAAYDAVDNDGFQEPQPWDRHGTACAGLVASIPTSPLAMTGIGPGCSVVAVGLPTRQSPVASGSLPNRGFGEASIGPGKTALTF